VAEYAGCVFLAFYRTLSQKSLEVLISDLQAGLACAENISLQDWDFGLRY